MTTGVDVLAVAHSLPSRETYDALQTRANPIVEGNDPLHPTFCLIEPKCGVLPTPWLTSHPSVMTDFLSESPQLT